MRKKFFLFSLVLLLTLAGAFSKSISASSIKNPGSSLTNKEERHDRKFSKEERDKKFKTMLDDLVKSGEITKEEGDKAYRIVKESQGRVEFSKLPEKVQQALKKRMPKCGGRFSDLTDEQCTALIKAMVENIKIEINTLVSKGTITKEQGDMILSHKKEELKNSLTDEQKSALKAAFKTAKTRSIEKLIQDGVLTKEEGAKLQQEKRKHEYRQREFDDRVKH